MSRCACPTTAATGTRFRIETPQVSWLGDSLRLLSRCRKSNRSSGAAFPLRPESRDSERRTVARAENFRLTVARRRRLFTVFPCAESLVIVDGAAKSLSTACEGEPSTSAIRIRFYGSHDDVFLVVGLLQHPVMRHQSGARHRRARTRSWHKSPVLPAPRPAVAPLKITRGRPAHSQSPPQAAPQTLPPANRAGTLRAGVPIRNGLPFCSSTIRSENSAARFNSCVTTTTV